MADLSQTRANVAIGGPASVQWAICGEAVLQGQPGYQDTSTGKWMKAANTSQAAAKAACFFMSPGSGDGAYVLILRGNGILINLGATLVVGKTYVVSGSGAIIELSELTSTKWISHLGNAISSLLLRTKFNITDTQVP